MAGFWSNFFDTENNENASKCCLCRGDGPPPQGGVITQYFGKNFCDMHLSKVKSKMKSIVISTGDIKCDYDIINVVATTISGENIEGAFDQLKFSAITMGGNGVIQLRVSCYTYAVTGLIGAIDHVHIKTLVCGTVIKVKK